MLGHELSGVVAELGYGTTGLTVGQRVFGLIDWTRNGSLAEYAAVEARSLAPLLADIDHTVAAALPISGLTAWQGLIDHARLGTGQTVLVHGAAGGVGSIAMQLAREVGARVIGTGRAADRDIALGLGVDAFLDLQADRLEDAGEVDVVFDVIGGEILNRSAAMGAPAARSSPPSGCRRSNPRTGAESSSSSKPTVSGWRTSPSDSGTGGSSRLSGQYGRSPKRLLVRPRPAYPRQDGHPDHRRWIGAPVVRSVGYVTDAIPRGVVLPCPDASLHGWPSPPATPRRRDA